MPKLWWRAPREAWSRILAFLTDPPVVHSILVHLDLPHRPPPLAPARGPPGTARSVVGDFLFDQSPGADLTEPDPVAELDLDQSGPEFDFDQSLPDPFDD